MNGPIIRPQNVPTSDQKAALAGTNGSPSASNKYVTDSDPRVGTSGASGVSGYSGESGVSGYSGMVGMAGGYFLFYSFDTTVGGNPAAGYIRLAGSSDPTTATHLHVSETDHNSVNVDTILDSIAVGDIVKIFCTHDATIYHMFQVTGTFTSTGSPPYDPIPVTWLAGGGTLTNELHIGFTSATKGASGYSGYSGESGASGASGTSGESGASGASGVSGSGVSGYSGYSGYSGVKVLASPGVNQTSDGPTTSTYQAGASITIMDLVYLNGSSQWALTDADAETTAKGILAISLESKTTGQAMNVALPGSVVRNDTWNWTPGATLYMDTATSGQIVATAPSGIDDVVRVVGWALTADVIYFMPSADYITRTG